MNLVKNSLRYYIVRLIHAIHCVSYIVHLGKRGAPKNSNAVHTVL